MSKDIGRVARVDDSREVKEAVGTAYADSLAAFSPSGQTGSLFRQLALAAAVLIPLLLVAIAVGAWNWNHVGGANMDGSGYVALAIGIVATLGLGIGLMCLVFYSNRHDYDEGAAGS